MRLLAYAALAALCTSALPAAAAPIGFGFNAGPITGISDATGGFAGFSVGEDLFFEFTIDGATPDSNSIPGFGRFRDPTGTLKVTGLSRGTTLTLADGIQISFNGFAQIEITGSSSPFNAFVLGDGINLQGTMPFVTDPEDLPRSLAELEAAVIDGLFVDIGNSSSSSAEIANLPIGASSFNRLTIGPVKDATTPLSLALVPLPAGGVLLLTGLAAVAALRRRKPAA